MYTYLEISPIELGGSYFPVQMHRIGRFGFWITASGSHQGTLTPFPKVCLSIPIAFGCGVIKEP